MKVLGFDQATGKTGYALFADDGTMDYGLINLTGKAFKELDTNARARLMALHIKRMIDSERPDVVVIEDVALRTNVKTLIELARLQGEIYAWCDDAGIPVVCLAPSQWRKQCGIVQGRKPRPELKREAQEYVKKQFQADATADEAEAICIAWAAWMNMSWKVEVQKEASNDGEEAGK